ncbi:ABC transporter transmembrane domain-containing protein [Paenibacillus doosanensis]|uniref:ABC transporter ATP-binding protein n=1 Tax=Paenibacillus konkukensis TaxID=2020716 RepID=A0ABY4RI02_9BACL|nr:MULTISPECIES: ABC transporter transmembrane domain-containing protein [Paenibacillus]MCS7459808.1 ABC transporter transmembrane domain-containing protein [Paenibacillus doosanensis]UQZ81773.1 putative ABC transporter ATP-binding protein [Paenibacillus konkukensis]
MNFFKALLRYFTVYKLLCGVFLFSIFFEVAYAVAAPLSLKYLVDEAFAPKNFQVFIVILSILLGGGLLNIAASACGDYSLGRVSGEGIRQLRNELFAHLQKQSLPFYQRYRVGDLVTRFAEDMASIERVIRISLPFFLKEALSILLGLFMLFSIEWKLTLAVLAGSALMFAGPRLLQGRAEAVHSGYKEAQERFSNTIDEMAKGHKTIKGLHQQQRFRELAREQIHNLFSLGFKMHMTNSLMERLPLTTLLILNGIMIGFGGYLIFHDEMSVGGFMAFFTLFMSVGQAGSNVSFLLPNLIDSRISFRRIGEILEQQPDVPEAAQPAELPATFAGIRMERVSFGYTEDNLQLKDVSLHIKPGTYVAFVGPSGSGKSTALQLLSRFYDPKDGIVAIGEHDLRTVSEFSLRSLATLVTQETFLFHATIRDNLLLDNKGVTEADMIEAAKQARIHDIIAGWPEGYDTWIHHEGGSLSGGERQRIAIARALLRRPQLLLLDEVTSALDPATEADINQLLRRIRGHRTIVSVTHRLASVVDADTIYVFQDGRIVESGAHPELLQLQGLYKSLWEKQHGFHLSEDGRRATVDVERLAKLPFFQGIEAALLENIAGLFATETCKEGEVIVRQGDEGGKCYILVRGKVEILKYTPEAGEKRVAVLQDGDHFGEIALLKDIPRNATVRALGPAVLLSVRREAFLQLTAEYPQIRRTLEDTLQQRM